MYLAKKVLYGHIFLLGHPIWLFDLQKVVDNLIVSSERYSEAQADLVCLSLALFLGCPPKSHLNRC